MSHNLSTAEILTEFAGSCLSGTAPSLPGIHSESRVKVYQNLIANIFSNALNKAFPIARKLLDTQWSQLTSEFLTNGTPSSPALWMMPQDFLDYVVEQKIAHRLNLPFLEDLLLFEWTEVYIYMKEDGEVPPEIQSVTDLKNQTLVLNPDATILPLKHAVFRPIPQNGQVPTGDFYLLAYRHPGLLNVRFIELQPLFVLALQHMATGTTGRLVIEKLVQTAPNIGAEHIETKTLEFLNAMIEQGVILGATHPGP